MVATGFYKIVYPTEVKLLVYDNR